MRKLFVVVVLVASPALAHDDWISQQRLVDPISGEWCCDHKDCAPVQKNGVQEVPGGYFVYKTGETVPYRRVVWKSPDGAWWLCHMYKNGKPVVRCLIGPPPGS